jgi:ABC-type sugar transport system permease subunit
MRSQAHSVGMHPRSKALSARRKLSQEMPLYIMLAPAIVLVLIYSYGPMIGIVMAFQRVLPGKGILGSPFIGFDNFLFVMEMPNHPASGLEHDPYCRSEGYSGGGGAGDSSIDAQQRHPSLFQAHGTDCDLPAALPFLDHFSRHHGRYSLPIRRGGQPDAGCGWDTANLLPW